MAVALDTQTEGKAEPKPELKDIPLSAEEKLAVITIENECLKAQIDFQNAQSRIKSCQESFAKTMDGLTIKHKIDLNSYTFDMAKYVFTPKNGTVNG